MRRLIEVWIHGKLYFVLVIFVGINLSIAAMTLDLKLTHMLLTDSQRASNRFNQVVEAKRFEGVFLCRKIC